jgi:hypothetical protein
MSIAIEPPDGVFQCAAAERPSASDANRAERFNGNSGGRDPNFAQGPIYWARGRTGTRIGEQAKSCQGKDRPKGPPGSVRGVLAPHVSIQR